MFQTRFIDVLASLIELYLCASYMSVDCTTNLVQLFRLVAYSYDCFYTLNYSYNHLYYAICIYCI